MLDLNSALDSNAVRAKRAVAPRLERLQRGESITHLYLHWIASSYAACDGAYNLVVNLRADPTRWNVDIPTSPRLNAVQVGGGAPYAAHTYGRNSHAVGISVACMGGPNVSPSNFGEFPLQAHELETLCAASAAIVAAYGIVVDPQHVMTHAEAAIADGYFVTDHPSDGVTRWDLSRFEPATRALTKAEAAANGNRIRARIAQYLRAR